MCCDINRHSGQTQRQQGRCGCGGMSCSCPVLWSKKKRIRMVEQSPECLQTKIADLQDLLQELKDEQ